jgi:heat shock protein HslJ
LDTGGVTTRLTLDTLAGKEWVLRAWNVGEAAPNQPEVTLVYQDGRLSGTSGCNRYTTTPKVGDMPGDLTVGQVVGTRMACPEPQSAVEARFLRQLEGTRKFGFFLGQLSITYEGDGKFGVMLFDGRSPTAAPNP